MGLRGPAEELSPTLEIALRLNQILANLYLHRPGPALRDCLVLSFKASGSKAFALTTTQRHKVELRKLQAAYELRLWTTAQDALSRCKSLDIPKDKWSTFQSELQDRLAEAKGKIDWVSIFGKILGTPENASKYITLSDYRGPIEVRTTQGRGRGLFLTRDVKAGELIVLEKYLHNSKMPVGAFVTVFEAEISEQNPRMSTGTAGHALSAFIADPSKLLVSNALHRIQSETRLSCRRWSDCKPFAILSAPSTWMISPVKRLPTRSELSKQVHQRSAPPRFSIILAFPLQGTNISMM